MFMPVHDELNDSKRGAAIVLSARGRSLCVRVERVASQRFVTGSGQSSFVNGLPEVSAGSCGREFWEQSHVILAREGSFCKMLVCGFQTLFGRDRRGGELAQRSFQSFLRRGERKLNERCRVTSRIAFAQDRVIRLLTFTNYRFDVNQKADAKRCDLKWRSHVAIVSSDTIAAKAESRLDKASSLTLAIQTGVTMAVCQ